MNQPRSITCVDRFVLLLKLMMFAGLACLTWPSVAWAQEDSTQSAEPLKPPISGREELSLAAAKVDVNPIARDEEIRQRLQNVLNATGWFIDPMVEVEEGVVFLNGQVETEELKKWAGDLARNTQDVVAVANRMEVPGPVVWDFRPAWAGMLNLWRDLLLTLPFFVFGLFTLALSLLAGMLAARVIKLLLQARIRARLLRNVIAYGFGALVVLSGVYIVLRVSGLTQLALTVVGGTGLIGLAVGIAFRNITENFLASIFLSLQQPFESGDLVDVAGVTGYVQQLNVRTTILMTLDGIIVQIPNASVYNSNIRNFTTNANRREMFDVGIGYEDSIIDAQEIVRSVLAEHPAVLNDPEPAVLVSSLGKSTVNLSVYFWLNGREHSWLKVRSSVIRLVKLAFQKHGMSLPGDVHEVVFPQGIHANLQSTKTDEQDSALPQVQSPFDSSAEDPNAVTTNAEAGLYSEAIVIEEQARQAQLWKGGENLLPAAAGTPMSEKEIAEPKPT